LRRALAGFLTRPQAVDQIGAIAMLLGLSGFRNFASEIGWCERKNDGSLLAASSAILDSA
jgi:hypothetical protein